MPVTKNVIVARDLCKKFTTRAGDVRVLDDLNLSLEPGESLALMGRSGSGKSTLLNILAGLESWDSGEIELMGTKMGPGDTQHWSAIRRTLVASVFQEANLMPTLTLAENVELRASLAGHDKTETGTWLADLGLSGLENRYPDQVSGGQRQRAAIAMAFGMAPALILADEPTGSLDRHTADLVADYLFDFQHQTRCPLLLATHDTALAERCDRTLTLDSGA